jgi:hypothetical protein
VIEAGSERWQDSIETRRQHSVQVVAAAIVVPLLNPSVIARDGKDNLS